MTEIVEQPPITEPDPAELGFRRRTLIEMTMGGTVVSSYKLKDAEPVGADFVPESAMPELVEQAIRGQKILRSIARIGERTAAGASFGVGSFMTVWSVWEQTESHTGLARMGMAAATFIGSLLMVDGTVTGVKSFRNKTPALSGFKRRLDVLRSIRQAKTE
jgi:hypothetical protein